MKDRDAWQAAGLGVAMSQTFASWQESYEKLRQSVEKQRHFSADKGPYSQGYGLASGHVQL